MYAPGKTDSILDAGGLLAGHAQDMDALTGVTVVLMPQGAAAGVDIRGGGSGTRETPLLDPLATIEQIHAVVLAGGSAFGLDAAGGVMDYLESQGIGFDAGVTKVPLVTEAILFDLAIGRSDVRPDKAMGYAACLAAKPDSLEQGCVGAGTGAVIGKMKGAGHAMKSGIGSASCRLANGFTVGALVAVNAIGDVRENGRILAGMLNQDHSGFINSSEYLLTLAAAQSSPETPEDELLSFQRGRNTTIGVIACNGGFTKAQLTKIASMGHNGMARAIRPVHSTLDGDTLFALSTGNLPASVDAAGEMAAIAVERAIIKAVTSAHSAGGLPAWRDLTFSN